VTGFAFGGAACTGGGGGLPGGFEGWEEDTGQRSAREAPIPSGIDGVDKGGERPTSMQDRPPASGEGSGSGTGGGAGASGGGGGGTAGFVCSGTYTCTLNVSGETNSFPLPLSEQNGVCTVGGQLVLDPDGTFTAEEGQQGTWEATANGLRITVQGVSIDCTKTG
jgi:hypothetical protein